MKSFNSNQDFYNHIDKFVERLFQTDCIEFAKKIRHRLHDVAWTTTSELCGELKKIFQELLNTQSTIPEDMKNDVKDFISTIDKAWKQANLG